MGIAVHIPLSPLNLELTGSKDYNNQYSTTSWGAQGGGDGGGFMPGSQNEGGSGERTYQKNTLRPVTIKQLIDAHHPNPDADHFMVDGAEMTQVTFVGQIRNVSRQATNVTYKVDDGTGLIEVKEWVDSDAADAALNRPDLAVQAYARVWGRLKVFNNQRTVGANFIRPVSDPNELQYHLLEATAVHLHFSRGPIEAVKANGGQSVTSGTSGADTSDLPANTSAAARKVYNCIRETPQMNEGLNLHDISLRTGMDESMTLKAAHELTASGVVYTTTDEYTWAIL